MSDPPKTALNAARFAPTRWTLVLRARGGTDEAREALSDLCAAYYGPVHGFVWAAVRDADRARDLTHDFFARVLRGGAFDHADPGRGRFRSFLLGAVKHFLSDMRDRDQAQKRGGGREPVVLDPGTDTSPGFDAPDPRPANPDLTFDRQWAFTLLDRALKQLADELAAAGRFEHYEALKPWLTGAGPLPQREIAQRLGMSESAVKVAIHRLRSRFRRQVAAEIAQTVDDPRQIVDELNYLIEVVAR